MRLNLLGGACAASMLLALTPAASAADFDMPREPEGWGWYVSLFGGWSMPTEDTDFSYSGGIGTTFTSVSGEFDLDDGFMAGIALGAQINGWLRGEVELSGHWHDAEGNALVGFATVTGPSSAPVTNYLTTNTELDGEANAMFVLANLWIDLPIGEIIRPYLGGGVGMGRLDVELETQAGGATVIDDSDWGFAYQAGGGVAFDLIHHVALDIGYRYKVINDAELDVISPAGFKFEADTDYKSHNILVGVRFGF